MTRKRATSRKRPKPSTRGAGADAYQPPLAWYLDLSERPLQILIFLLPLVLVYEIGMIAHVPHTTGGFPVEISASKMLRDVYSIFDVSAFHLPAITLVVVLLIWHVLKRDRWEVHLGLPLVMLVESMALAIPLLVVDQLMRRITVGGGLPAASVATVLMQDGGSTLLQLDWQTRLVLSVGAGLYEELIFRMIVIAAAHALFVDVFRAPRRVGAAMAILVSAVSFTLYHDLSPGGSEIEVARALFLFIAGVYFAFLYVARGFGIVVGAHAAYDVLATIILPAVG